MIIAAARASHRRRPRRIASAEIAENSSSPFAASANSRGDHSPRIRPSRSCSPILYPLAHVGLARAATLTGDTSKARTAYEKFFAMWKNADPEIPILREANHEAARLKERSV